MATQAEMDALLLDYRRKTGETTYSPRYTTKKVTVPNPELEGLSDFQRANKIRAGVKPTIEQEVAVQRWENASGYIEAYVDPLTQEYVIANDRRDATPSAAAKSTPQQDAQKEAEALEARRAAEWQRDHGPNSLNPETGQPYGASAPGSGRYETHTERAKREADEATQARQGRTEDRQTRIDEDTAATRAAELRRQQAQDARDAAKLATDQAAQREATRLANAKFEYEKEQDVADEVYRNRPQIAGTPTDTAKNVAVWDPTTQTLRSVENPMYDAAKVQAAQLKDQLSTAIALNQISSQQAAAQYKQWWDTNVELPFKQAQEQRARAAEQRAALEAEDRRKQFASDFSLRSGDLGFRAGNAAVQNEISLLPYRAGPEAGEQFSAAFNSLAQGGKVYGPDAGAGINFTADAFEFDRPDFEGIAKKATANALKGLTQYKPSGKYSQADYSGISMPSGAGAPSGAGSQIDTSALWQQYAGGLGVPAYAGPQDNDEE